MRYCVYLLVLALLIFASLSNITVSATHPAVAIDGTVTKSGCRVIGGDILTDTIDTHHTQTIELCEFDNKYFRIVQYAECVASEGVGRGPDTGRIYTFPTPCDIPRVCKLPESWGNIGSYYYYDKLQVKVEEKQFDIWIGSKGAICNFLEFVQEEKKISIIARGVNGTKTSIDVTIPNELLSGEFKVMVDGRSTEFNIKKTEVLDIPPSDVPPSSTLTIDLDFPENEMKIDIIGTQVIPEFPAFGLIIFAAAISLILATKLMPKSRPSTGNSY